MNTNSADSSSKKEKRRYFRKGQVKKVNYKVLVPIEGEGFTQNISQDGYALFLDNEVPPGSVIELIFEDTTRNQGNERSIAKIIWQKDNIAGVKVLGK